MRNIHDNDSLGNGDWDGFLMRGLALSALLIVGGVSAVQASPAVPAVGTDMNCPALSGGIPNVVGSTDNLSLTCFAAPTNTGPQGVPGTNGQTPSITIGTVSSLPAGSTPTATITGTTPNLTLGLGLTVGNTGVAGSNGTNAASPNFTFPTPTTIGAGGTPTASVSGAYPNLAVQLGLVTGNTGAAGSSPNCTTPMGTALNPIIGTGTPCIYRPDSTVRLQEQTVNTVTTTGGVWSVTWARTMTTSTPIIHSDQLDNSTNAGNCKVMTRSATGASGICFTGSILTVLGIQVSLLSVVAANVPVMVTGAEATQ